VIPARIAAVGEWGTANGERFAYSKSPFLARKKGQPAITATEIRACVGEPKATYLELLCC
jgi:hypothetical protein